MNTNVKQRCQKVTCISFDFDGYVKICGGVMSGLGQG